MGSPQVSGKLASDFVSEAREDLNEFTSLVFSDEYLLSKLNRGTTKIVAQSHCLDKKLADIAVIADTYEYAISATDSIGIKTVLFSNDGVLKGLLRGNLQSVGHNPESGIPAFWVESEGNLIIYPRPETPYITNCHLEVYVIQKTDDVVLTEAVLVPAIYDDALLFYMIGSALYKDKKFQSAGLFMARCEMEVEKYRMDFAMLQKEPREIVK